MNQLSKGLILTTVQALQNERSVYGAYHLLQGKRSAQTIQDGFLFNMLHVYGLLASLSRNGFDELLSELVTDGLLFLKDDKALLTENGKEALNTFLHQYSFIINGADGWKRKDIVHPMWKRLSLFVQTLSHLQKNNRAFYPMTLDFETQKWVKEHLPREKEKREVVFQSLHVELLSFLERVETIQADVFVYQLSGYEVTGLVKEQLSQTFDYSILDVQVIHLVTLHQLVHHVLLEPMKYAVCDKMIEKVTTKGLLTQSAQKTFTLLKKGMTVDDICSVRRLKASTIEDHLVEIALQDKAFNLRPFLPVHIEERIQRAALTLQTRKLRVIKEALQDLEVSYFQIRLTLVRMEVDPLARKTVT